MSMELRSDDTLYLYLIVFTTKKKSIFKLGTVILSINETTSCLYRMSESRRE